ncbi:MAG: bifunctional phosphopantothenoylcysteine decarboxylase/phosphopantothenate--cysteine ligase CoaBC [Anaerolineaceae bacterium]
MKNPIEGKTILLGVTGSIAIYKAADLASKLTQAGAKVDVVLTEKALHFMNPLTFQSVTGRKAYTEADLWGGEGHVVHIELGRAAELVLIAPISANTMASLAHGIADNLLTVATLASHCPLMIAPAMDGGMFANPATQANLHILKNRGAIVIGPAEGHLASGLVGPGRMEEPADIFNHVRFLFSRGGPLEGKNFVVTAGGTQEPIDPVRFITNRSSGKQGYAVAQAALNAGADVTLITTATEIPTPVGAVIKPVETAAEMQHAVEEECQNAYALIMAAAVADFTPVHTQTQKIKKETGIPVLELQSTTDILKLIGEKKVKTGFPKKVVGFAAESQNLLANARHKLESKNLDLIIANDIMAEDAGFEVDTNRVVLIPKTGEPITLPLLSKQEVAEKIIDVILDWG